MFNLCEVILVYCQFSPFFSFVGYIVLVGLQRLCKSSYTHINFMFYRFYVFFNLCGVVVVCLYFLFNSVLYNVDYVVYIFFGFISYSLSFNFISLNMMILVGCVSFVVHLYSIWYMSGDLFVDKFLAYLSLFTGSMFILVLSNNLLQMFIGWELVGVSSFLLIGFWSLRREALRAACKALFLNKIGDFFFLVGIALTFKYVGSFDLSVIRFFFKDLLLIYINSWLLVDIVVICFFIAAVAKSAQVGLHMWLIDAMEGPTPVSALIHAATMVTAGVYLFIKIQFFIVYCSYFVIVCISVWGSLTAFIGGLLAVFQFDVKKIIAYSTMSQLGYMMCVVCLYPEIALYHLINHGWFKALLFLAAGVVIHCNNNEQDIRGLQPFMYKRLPITFFIFVISSLAMIAVPLTSGFFSKDVIYEVLMVSKWFGGCYILLLCSGFCTITYSVRLLYFVFFKKGFCVRVYTVEPIFVVFSTYIPLICMSVVSGYIYNFLIINLNFFVDIKLFIVNVVYMLLLFLYYGYIHQFVVVRFYQFNFGVYFFVCNRLGIDSLLAKFYSELMFIYVYIYMLIESGVVQFLFGPMWSVLFRGLGNYVWLFESFDSFRLIIVTIFFFIFISLFF